MQLIQDTRCDTNTHDLKLLHGQSFNLKLKRGEVLGVRTGQAVVTRRIWLDNTVLTLKTPCARGGIYEATTAEWVDVHAEQGATVWIASLVATAPTRPNPAFWRNRQQGFWFTTIVAKLFEKINLGVNFSLKSLKLGKL